MEPRSKKRIKVLFIIDKWNAGGRQRVLQQLINAMDAAAFEIVFLILSKPAPSFPLPNARICVLPFMRYRSSILPLARIIRAERPDIISSHLGVLMVPIVHIAALVSLMRPAIIYTIQSIFDLTSYKQTSYPRINKFLIAWSLRGAAGITTASEGMMLPLSQEFGVRTSLMHMAPHPVYTAEDCRPRDFESARATVRVLTIGRLAYPKDFSTILKSFKKAQEQSTVSLSLSIIGNGQDGAALRAEAHELGIDDSVFKGEANVDSGTFDDADIFIFSSRSEGMPVVLIEALASGVPSIATDCDFGPRELIRNGESGFLVPVGDVDAMTGAILRLCRDPHLMRAFSAAGPAAVTRFEVHHAAREWQKIFIHTVRF